MKKKNLIITIIVILIIVLLVISIVFLPKKKNQKPVNERVKYVDDIVQNIFYDKNVSEEKIEKTINGSLIEDFVFIGKDSSLRHMPKNDLIKKYKLGKYVSIIKKYSNKVENIAMKNIEYKVVRETDNAIVYEIKPWYAINYSIDLDYLKDYIMADAGFKTTAKNNSTEEYGTNEFKARAIAIRILDSHLDDYNNTGEIRTFNFYFNNEKPVDHQLLSMYFNLQGVTSDACLVRKTDQDREKEKLKMKEYLKEAEEQGLYNKNNPYKI